MSRINARDRKKIYQLLVEWYGPYCKICGEKGDYHTLELDHIDGNPDNRSVSNYELLCKICNCMKDPKGKHLRSKKVSPARVNEFALTSGKTAEMEKNAISEPLFRRWLFRLLRQEDKVEYNIVIEAGAEVSHASIDALKRYAKKVYSQTGWAELVKDENNILYIRLRKPWQKKVEKKSEIINEENNIQENSLNNNSANILSMK